MGFWDSPFGEVLKFGGKVAVSTLAAGSIVASDGATVPLLSATGATGYATGKVVKIVGKECDCELLEWVGETVSDTGVGVFTGGVWVAVPIKQSKWHTKCLALMVPTFLFGVAYLQKG